MDLASAQTQLERLEKSHAAELSVESYAKLMLCFIGENTPRDVKHLWKRTPDQYKTNLVLQGLVDTARFFGDKLFAKAFARLGLIPWPTTDVQNTAEEVNRRLRTFAFEHIRRVYTVISVDRFAEITGFEKDYRSAVGYAQEMQEWVAYDHITNMISVKEKASLNPTETDLEPYGYGAELDALKDIGDTAWSLGKSPFVISEGGK